MPDIEVIILLLVVIVGFSAIVDKLKIPQSVVLVFVGLIMGFIPQIPDVILQPDTVFLIFLPPLLFTAAWKLSWHSFKAERRSIISLSTGLVFFTTVAIAFIAHYFIPGFTWQLGFVLGAIISPPDAVAATSVTKGLNLNKRIVTILEGESLINDASALVAYRYAILSVVAGGFVFWHAGLQFIWVAAAGSAIGLAIGVLLMWAQKQINNNSTLEVALTLLTPYIAYLLAEHFHLSGVLAVVAAGLYISYRSPESFSFQTRIQANSFWETIEFLLNGFVFILIGMQLPGILDNIERESLVAAIGYGVLITLVAIVVRVLWVFPGAYLPVLFTKKSKRKPHIDWRYLTIISWTGMRGVVSLASALAIPLTLANGKEFPQRDMILFLTFCVIFLTLVVQGLSLKLVIKLLKISPDMVKEREEENAVRKHIAMRAMEYIDKNILHSKIEEEAIHRLRSKYEMNLRSVSEKTANTSKSSTKANAILSQYAIAQKEVLDFERSMLIQLHKEDKAESELMKKLEYELDMEESRISEQMKRMK
jgi:Na+/H+ antiporter